MEKNPKTKTLKMNAPRFGRLAILAALIASASCITVNVNFPESAVQRAADEFVKDLYKDPGKKIASDEAAKEAAKDAAEVKKAVKKNKKKTEPASEKPAGSTHLRINFGVAEAYAVEAELEMHTPKIESIRVKMSAQGPALEKWKKSGVICETNDGMLDMADASKAGGAIDEVQSLIDKQNGLRKDFFKEVEKANSINNDSGQAKIRKIFAGKFQEAYPPACK